MFFREAIIGELIDRRLHEFDRLPRRLSANLGSADDFENRANLEHLQLRHFTEHVRAGMRETPLPTRRQNRMRELLAVATVMEGGSKAVDEMGDFFRSPKLQRPGVTCHQSAVERIRNPAPVDGFEVVRTLATLCRDWEVLCLTRALQKNFRWYRARFPYLA
jgi:hypothetical protein